MSHKLEMWFSYFLGGICGIAIGWHFTDYGPKRFLKQAVNEINAFLADTGLEFDSFKDVGAGKTMIVLRFSSPRESAEEADNATEFASNILGSVAVSKNVKYFLRNTVSVCVKTAESEA